MIEDYGSIYTKGNSYRARAERRQRWYRAEVLGASHGRYGHILSEKEAAAGSNFILSEAREAARQRERAGKGTAPRTFNNMLSSQAMCFNVFGPLAARLELAAEVLKPFIDGLIRITAIHIEYTPAGDVFFDQSGTGGVDCDILIEGSTTTGRLIQVIETKFVEPKFSVCGFRRPGRKEKGQQVCPRDVPVGTDLSACLYVQTKGYAYWKRTKEHQLLVSSALGEQGCPFGGVHWQLWVNLALAYEEAKRRGASDVRFAVCTSQRNTALLGRGEVLEQFQQLLRTPSAVTLLDLEQLLLQIKKCAPTELEAWEKGLWARYGAI